MARIVIELSDEHKELCAAIGALVEHVSAVSDRITVGGKPIDYARVERAIGEKSAAIERAAHQAILRGLDIDVARVVIDGVPWSRVGRHEATYYTMAGPVEVARSVYRRDGERNGKVVDPIGCDSHADHAAARTDLRRRTTIHSGSSSRGCSSASTSTSRR